VREMCGRKRIVSARDQRRTLQRRRDHQGNKITKLFQKSKHAFALYKLNHPTLLSLSLSLYTNEIEPKLPKEEEEDEEDEEDGHARCFQSTRERFHSRHCITYLMIVLIALDDGHEKRCDKESLGYCNDRER